MCHFFKECIHTNITFHFTTTIIDVKNMRKTETF